jgi:type IV secretory pathway TrbD component
MKVTKLLRRSLLGRLTQAALTVGGLFGFAASFVPNMRDWLADHGVLGWAVASALAVVLAASGTPQAGDPQSDGHQAQRRYEADRRLLLQRVDGWEPDSDFFRWLVNEVNHKHFPDKRWNEIGGRLRAWSTDERAFNDPELERAFTRARTALSEYNELLALYLFSVPGHPAFENHSSVPAEWSYKYPEKHSRAFTELSSARNELISALTDVFQVAHGQGADLRPQTSSE